MMKYNVKKIENTNTMTTTLTTSCKKRDTAISRFCRFLSEYDSCFKDSMLLCTMKIEIADHVDGNALYQATVETDEYYMAYTECGDVYQVTIEFKHDENTTTYKSLANTSVSDNTNDNETVTDSADGNDNETPTNNKTPAELKAEINNKYGVNAVYYDTDSVLCDTEKQNVCIHHDKATDSTTCYIKAYYDGKELTIPYNEYKCKECAIEYIHNLFMDRVIPYETLFILYYGKHVETIAIEMVFDTPDLLQYNIDDINVGLKTGYYKKVREGVERLCALIDDNHVCVVGFKYTKHIFDYAITKSKDQGSYNFKRGNNNWIQKPSEIARFIFYHIFAHEFELKYWHTIKEGDTK